MRKIIFRVFPISLSIIFFAMIVEIGILHHVNRKNSIKMTNALLTQVSENINANQENSRDLYISVKDDYIVRSQAVSYILDSNPSAEKNIDELKKIATLLSIDEISLFDETGTIYSSTVPKYVGLSFNSGEQIGYFKPMLKDKSLSLCQDVTPNTSEGKQMMYAMTWNEKGTGMVQVGIEPQRLIEALNRNEIPTLVQNLTIYDGVYIFVAESRTGRIIGMNPVNPKIKNLIDLGIKNKYQINEICNQTIKVNGKLCYSSIAKTEDFIICVAYRKNVNRKTHIIIMIILFVYLFLASILVTFLILKIGRTSEEKQNQLRILSSMSEIYYSMHLINIKENTVTTYSESKSISKACKNLSRADEMMRSVMNQNISEEYREKMLAFSDISTIPERMKGKKLLTQDFIGIGKDWYKASFITIDADKDGVPERVIFTTQNIDEEKHREAMLLHKSTTDEFTGCLNRRAYQDFMKTLNPADDFVYVSFDLNGLKNTNDILGHDAGDEIISAVAGFLKQCFAKYGQIYRTGGDEFVAILFVTEDKFFDAVELFNKKMTGWSGKLVKVLSVSYGYVFTKEQKWKNLHEIEIEADKRMYRQKAEYYQKSGVDRRENQKVYYASGILYAKILKINLTEDSYKVVSADKSEMLKETSSENTISIWLKNFVQNGQVLKSDVKIFEEKLSVDYMRNYFTKGNKLLSVSYSRKIDGHFQKVLTEVIPADDYTNENQVCYLYVKKI